MAKRHSSLVPLARDHYHGLLLALRLQQGEKALERLWSHDPAWQAKYVVDFYEKDLSHHFEAEERGLFPFITDVDGAQPLVDDLLRDHRRFEQYVEEFRADASQATRERLAEFGKLLEEHIRKEDRVLFPLLEKEAAPEVLETIKQKMGPYYHG